MTQSKRYEIAPETPYICTATLHHYGRKRRHIECNPGEKSRTGHLGGIFYQSHLVCRKNHSRHMGGESSAMIADGIHSLSDFITDFIVIIFIKISSKNEDSDHPYGHGKFETFATMLISFALFVVAIGIFYSGSIKIYEVLNGEIIERPTYLALAMAAVSIIVKRGLILVHDHNPGATSTVRLSLPTAGITVPTLSPR